ncbi:death-on-curing family protein [Natrinema thermotolerans DSM 11552]|nr:death-on-curing family protein [Natrinema thermotolerans DSM 11552]
MTADIDDATARNLVSDLADEDIVTPVPEGRVLVHEPSGTAFDSPLNWPSSIAPGRLLATISSALQYISEGFFGEVPETIHEKAVHLMRLLVADHPFVDGNKRTALRTVVVFYMLNGYTFDYGDEIRALLHRFATDEATVDTDTAVIYFRACSRRN